ncbi:hypothetical protein AVEN_205321-1 [Araneus ventricosus]|uniref:Uncharacterized protein n=1 Tax=Araneus ventricosus TaxID=182803 RepID=A0A4Y2MWA3_ARAVE|nr:hypothetical protein AVEN_205321-1 [Araneus ventricosus]
MTKTTPELELPLKTSLSHQKEDVWPPIYDLTCNGPNRRRSSVESGFEAGTHRLRSRHLVTGPPRQSQLSEANRIFHKSKSKESVRISVL